MRKLIGFSLLLISANVFATQSTFSSTLIKQITNQENVHHQPATTFIYGGQDLSRHIAIANESLWAGQPTLIG